MICPRCDGQGTVQAYTPKDTKLVIYVCDECDATWLTLDSIGTEGRLDLETYLRSIGIRDGWESIVYRGEAP